MHKLSKNIVFENTFFKANNGFEESFHMINNMLPSDCHFNQ